MTPLVLIENRFPRLSTQSKRAGYYVNIAVIYFQLVSSEQLLVGYTVITVDTIFYIHDYMVTIVKIDTVFYINNYTITIVNTIFYINDYPVTMVKIDIIFYILTTIWHN